jgi:C4-dicarboxylate transporter, DctM subunit
MQYCLDSGLYIALPEFAGDAQQELEELIMELSITAVGLIGIGIFLLLLFMGQNVGLAMLIAGFLGIAMIRGFDAAFSNLGYIVWRNGASAFLVVLPLYILMGMAATQVGVSKDLFFSLNKWFGHLPGGLAMAATAACTAFGALCGNVVATAATLGKVALPEMRKYGYDDELSSGTIASAGNLGVIVPPSTALIVYGFVTQTSIGALFAAGIIPAIILTIMLMVQIYIQVKLNPKLARMAPKASWKERLIALKGFIAAFIVFGLTMGGIMLGLFTPVEAGAIGIVAMFLVGIVTRNLSWKGFFTSIKSAGHISAMILLLIFGAMVFSSFLTVSELTQSFSALFMDLNLNPFLVMFIVLVFYFIMGTFMDSWALLIISLPIFFPIVSAAGFDALHFGVLCAITVAIGNISPPVGVTVFAMRGVAPELSVYRIFRGCVPFLITMVVFMIALMFVPQVTTLLPDLMIPYR